MRLVCRSDRSPVNSRFRIRRLRSLGVVRVSLAEAVTVGLVLELKWDFDWRDIEDRVLGGCCELCCRGEDQSESGERGKLPIQKRHEWGCSFQDCLV